MVRALAALVAAATAAAASPAGLDPSWSRDGVARTYLRSDPGRLAGVTTNAVAYAEGKIVVAGGGFYPDGDRAPLLLRYTPSGKLDPTFGGGDGVVRGRGFVAFAGWDALLSLPDGRVLVGGHSAPRGPFSDRSVIARFLRNGRLDRTFGDSGRIRHRFGDCEQWPVAFLPDTRGRTIVLAHGCGTISPFAFRVARLHANGRLDRSFGRRGQTEISPFRPVANAYPTGIARVADGKLLVVGYSVGEDLEDGVGVVRLLPNGAIDRAFGRRGTAAVYGYPAQRAVGPFVAENGVVGVLGCDGRERTTLLRFSPAGRLLDRVDLSRAMRGCARTAALGPDNTVVVTTDKELVRFGGDWSADPSFRVPSPPGFETVLVEPHGKVVTAAFVRIARGKYGFEVRRYLP